MKSNSFVRHLHLLILYHFLTSISLRRYKYTVSQIFSTTPTIPRPLADASRQQRQTQYLGIYDLEGGDEIWKRNIKM